MGKGKLLVLTGPSAGAGKDTLLRLFLKRHPDWEQPVSTTTRHPRTGEVAGVDMNFVGRETFEDWQREGKFLETDFHAGNWYGTLREPVETLLSEGKNVLLRIDVNGAVSIKKALPEAIIIFIRPESLEVLKQRLLARGTETEEEMTARLALAKKELAYEPKFDKVVINRTGQQENAVSDIEAIARV